MLRCIESCAVWGFLMVSTCAFAQKVEVSDFDKSDFSGLKTFRVAKGELTITGEEFSISENDFYGWVTEFVRNELEPRGYVFTEDSVADFTVDYVAGSYNINRNDDLGRLGGTPATDPAMMNQSRYWTQSYREGLFVLQMYRGKGKRLIWEAEGTTNLHPGQVQRALAGLIAKALRKFPKAVKP
ncbi:MAG TPA: DUF4136 domain-containing protein [Cyclobacteriaceae bacterium]